jgi:hypothetical protein
VRSGSTYSNSGGTIHSATRIIVHESYNEDTMDFDVALVQVSINFSAPLYNEIHIIIAVITSYISPFSSVKP